LPVFSPFIADAMTMLASWSLLGEKVLQATLQLGTIVVCCAAYLVMVFSFDRYWIRHCSDRQNAST
jgi:amino acid transporter